MINIIDRQSQVFTSVYRSHVLFQPSGNCLYDCCCSGWVNSLSWKGNGKSASYGAESYK